MLVHFLAEIGFALESLIDPSVNLAALADSGPFGDMQRRDAQVFQGRGNQLVLGIEKFDIRSLVLLGDPTQILPKRGSHILECIVEPDRESRVNGSE